MVSLTNADLCNAAALISALQRELRGIVTTKGAGDWFMFYDPAGQRRPLT
ncbi:MAG TPA: hypothetical protein VGP36_18910 [Mycobacteriales bacterium]|jgi:hypothetical protein|nr:hypothetical protein [Mycobacteriales bacterium]